MTVDLCIKNVRVVRPWGLVSCGIAIDNGKIQTIAKEPNLPRASERIDGKNGIALPGLVDIHTHCRDQGLSRKEDFVTATCAAAIGGITTILDMPNNNPPTNSAERLVERVRLAERRIVVNVGFFGAFPQSRTEAERMCKLGVIGFKVHTSNPIALVNVQDDEVLHEALLWAKAHNRIVAFHAEVKSLIDESTSNLKGRGKKDLFAYMNSHPPEAELWGIRRVLEIAGKVGSRIHFCHVSLGASLPLIVEAKRRGLEVSSEVTPHHLLLSSEDAARKGTISLVSPPLRSPSDRGQLFEALVTGLVDVVASDHAPHTIEEKTVDEVWIVPPGLPGLETELPLLLTQVNRGLLSLQRLIEVLAENPSRVTGLDEKGRLEEGFDADITIIDLKDRFTIDSSAFFSKARYSPFDGTKVAGRAVKVFVGGELAAEEGDILARPGSAAIISH